MSISHRDHPLNLPEKAVYLTVIVGLFASHVYFFAKNGYLSSPFFYDKYDTFMDFFNVQFWAFEDGVYSEWYSIYTPFLFALVRLMSLGINVNESDGFLLRDVHLLSFAVTYFIITLVLIAFNLKKQENNKLIYALLIFLSAPFLVAIERGNLIVLTYLFLLLAFKNYKNMYLFSLFLAAAISTKIYLVALIFVLILKNSYYRFFLVLYALFVMNYMAVLILDLDDWYLLFENLFRFSGAPDTGRLYEWSYFSYSYRNMLQLFVSSSGSFPLLFSILDTLVVLGSFCLYGIVVSKYLGMNRNNKEYYSDYIFTLLIMLIMIVVQNAGGYAIILLFPFVRIFTQDIYCRFLFIVMLLPASYELKSFKLVESLSYFSDQFFDISRSLDLFMIIRPVFFLILYVFVSFKFLLGHDRLTRPFPVKTVVPATNLSKDECCQANRVTLGKTF